MDTKLKGLFALNHNAFELIYAPIYAQFGQRVTLEHPPQTIETLAQHREWLTTIDCLFTGGGAPVLDEEFLAAAPNLKVVFYGAGSIRHMVTPVFWDSGIIVTSAASANAIPVAEYTLAQILFSLKGGWYYAHLSKAEKWRQPRRLFAGAYGSTVGIISLGMIGRLVCKLLRSFDLHIIAYDPFVTQTQADELGVDLCSLEDVFSRSDVVSLHTPWLPETVGMIKGAHFASMKANAAFINTARGAIINESEMIAVLAQRPDIYAVLDVTYPEPPSADSPLHMLPNVVLTPHIAGSMGYECVRMGQAMLEELSRYLNNEPLHWQVQREQFSILA